jgi:hypothetical protein
VNLLPPVYNLRITLLLQIDGIASMTRVFLSLALVVLYAGAPMAQSGAKKNASGNPKITEATTDHVRIRYVNTITAAADGLARLTIEIVPRARMHVYAPGADDYQIVTLTMAEGRGIRPRPVSYPASEIYHFGPLNERIPVYQKPFTLTLDMQIENAAWSGSADKSSLAISGRLDYQACDDKVCFAPVSVPLAWTVLRQEA